MPKATLADIRARALDFADVPYSSSWVTTARVNDIINDALNDLHTMIVESYEDYLTEQYNTTLASGTDSITVPSDFFKLRGIYIIDNNFRFRLEPWEWQDLHAMISTTVSARPRYRVMGQQIKFWPVALSDYTLEVWYIKQFKDLVADNDEIEPALPNGWDCYAVGHVAAYLLQRKEQDPGPALAYKEDARRQIESALTSRDAAGPKKFKDLSERYRKKVWYPAPIK